LSLTAMVEIVGALNKKKQRGAKEKTGGFKSDRREAKRGQNVASHPLFGGDTEQTIATRQGKELTSSGRDTTKGKKAR